MKLNKILVPILAAVISTMSVSANQVAEVNAYEVGLNMNNSDLELRGAGYLQFGSSPTILKASGSVLHADDFDKATIGVTLQNRIEPIPGAYFGVGLNYTYLESDAGIYLNLFQLPIVMNATYFFPELKYNIPPVAMRAEVQYAPEVLSFQDSKGYQYGSFETSIEPIEDIELYLGYRYGSVDSIYGDSKEFTNDIYFGLSAQF